MPWASSSEPAPRPSRTHPRHDCHRQRHAPAATAWPPHLAMHTEARPLQLVRAGASGAARRVGRKRLYWVGASGKMEPLDALCLLDFYVHERVQRSGTRAGRGRSPLAPPQHTPFRPAPSSLRGRARSRLARAGSDWGSRGVPQRADINSASGSSGAPWACYAGRRLRRASFPRDAPARGRVAA